MKILMFSLDANLLDPSSRASERMRAYAAVLDELHIIVPMPFPRHDAFSPRDNLHIHAAGRSIGYFLTAYRLGFGIIKRYRFSPHDDCITAQDAFPTGIVAWLLAHRTSMPLQLQAHTPFFHGRFIWQSPFQFIQYRVARFLYPRADAVRVVSREIALYMTDQLLIPKERISTLPVFSDFPSGGDGHDAGHFRAKYPQFSFIACMPTRFVIEKNIAMAIRAFIRLSSSHPDIGLIIQGRGPSEAALRRLARDANGSVIFEPWGDPSPLYRSADAYLCTSWYEGWCLGIVEAMHAGVPVITTPVGSANEFVRDGENGLVVPCDDSDALHNALLSLYRFPELRRRSADIAMRDACRFFSATAREHAFLIREGFRKAVANSRIACPLA